MNSDNTAENTDIEIWREKDGDYFSPSIHVTRSGNVRIDVSGKVFVKPIKEWHRMALNHDKLVEALKISRTYVAATAVYNKINKVQEQAESDYLLIDAALADVEGE